MTVCVQGRKLKSLSRLAHVHIWQIWRGSNDGSFACIISHGLQLSALAKMDKSQHFRRLARGGGEGRREEVKGLKTPPLAPLSPESS